MIARRDQCRSGSQRPYHRLYYCYKFLFLVYYGVKLSVVVVFVCYTGVWWKFHLFVTMINTSAQRLPWNVLEEKIT